MLEKLSINELSRLLFQLDEHQLSKIEREINKFRPSPDIVDFKRSQPFSIVQFIEQITILKTQNYYLLEPIHVSLIKCVCCHNKACVTLEYCNVGNFRDSHSFELCLHCFHAVKETPIYASAEEGA